jgi:hypothetical protein
MDVGLTFRWVPVGTGLGRGPFNVDNVATKVVKDGFESAGLNFGEGPGNFTRLVRARVWGSHCQELSGFSW